MALSLCLSVCISEDVCTCVCVRVYACNHNHRHHIHVKIPSPSTLLRNPLAVIVLRSAPLPSRLPGLRPGWALLYIKKTRNGARSKPGFRSGSKWPRLYHVNAYINFAQDDAMTMTPTRTGDRRRRGRGNCYGISIPFFKSLPLLPLHCLGAPHRLCAASAEFAAGFWDIFLFHSPSFAHKIIIFISQASLVIAASRKKRNVTR